MSCDTFGDTFCIRIGTKKVSQKARECTIPREILLAQNVRNAEVEGSTPFRSIRLAALAHGRSFDKVLTESNPLPFKGQRVECPERAKRVEGPVAALAHGR